MLRDAARFLRCLHRFVGFFDVAAAVVFGEVVVVFPIGKSMVCRGFAVEFVFQGGGWFWHCLS